MKALRSNLSLPMDIGMMLFINTVPFPSSLTVNEIKKQVCILMIQGQLKFYPEIPDIVEHPPENHIIKATDDILYRFIPIRSLLIMKNANIKHFKSTNDAKSFISEFNAGDEKLNTIANELKIEVQNTSAVNKDEVINAISTAIVTGNIVVIEDKISSPPPDESKIVKTKNTTGNRRADTIAPPINEFKKINIELLDEFDKNAAAFYKLFDDLEYTLKTDQ